MNKGRLYALRVNHILDKTIDIDGDDLSYTVTYGNGFDYSMGGLQVNFDGTEDYDKVRDELDKASKHLLKAFEIIHSDR